MLGRDYPEATVDHLGELYTRWAKGLLAWPFIDLPFTPYGQAVKAKQGLLDFFQVLGRGSSGATGEGPDVLEVLPLSA